MPRWKPTKLSKATFNRTSEKEDTMDQRAILDHQFTVAAYVVTWVIQLGYLAYVGLKWRAERRAERLNSRNSR